MKKVAVVVLAAMFFCIGMCRAEGFDISSLSYEELISLRNDINARLVLAEAENVLFDEYGISVAWYGIKETPKSAESTQYQIDFFVSNQNDETVFLGIDSLSINGVMISPSNNIVLEIPAHTSVYTAATNRWIFDTKTLESMHFSGTFEDVTVRLKFYHQDAEGKCSYGDLVATTCVSVVIAK